MAMTDGHMWMEMMNEEQAWRMPGFRPLTNLSQRSDSPLLCGEFSFDVEQC